MYYLEKLDLSFLVSIDIEADPYMGLSKQFMRASARIIE